MLRSLLSNEMGLVDAIVYAISAAVVVFLTMPIREWAQAFVATRLGDKTPKWQGRLSLNPMRHIDPYGALSVLILGFGWAKPVQVNVNNFKRPKLGMVLVALAGPVSNLIVAWLALVIYNVVSFATQIYFLGAFFEYIAMINIFLAVFNLIPVPPLDGSKILFAILPTKTYFKIMQYERYIFIGLMIVVFLGYLDTPINYLSIYVHYGLSYLAHLPFNLIGLLK